MNPERILPLKLLIHVNAVFVIIVTQLLEFQTFSNFIANIAFNKRTLTKNCIIHFNKKPHFYTKNLILSITNRRGKQSSKIPIWRISINQYLQID